MKIIAKLLVYFAQEWWDAASVWCISPNLYPIFRPFDRLASPPFLPLFWAEYLALDYSRTSSSRQFTQELTTNSYSI